MNALAAARPGEWPEAPSAAAMPVLPKSLLTLGASLQTARTRRRLGQKSTAVSAQEQAFRALTPKLAATSFGRRVGLEPGLRYAAFQARVPLHTYEQLAPFIERMKRGEADVLWPGQCSYYAVSSGTTAGRTKYLPITGEMFAHFQRAGLDSLLYYSARVGHARVFHGRHLFLGGSTLLAPVPDVAPFTAYTGDLSGLTTLHLPKSIEQHLYEPGAEIARMSDWPAKIAAIVRRTRPLDISLVAGIPSWLLILAEALRTDAAQGGACPSHLQEIWPNLECLVHGGVPLGPFHDDLRRAFGPTVNFHEVYPASEGFIAAQDATPGEGLRLMAGTGLFFEFLPMRDFDEARLPSLGAKAVPLAEVRAGQDYALVLTTPAGLCRYVIGDVVRFISTEPPRLIYVGRTQLQLSAFGEHVIEKELTDSLLAVCHEHGWTIVNFHVAPLFAPSLTGQNRGRHEWWIELRPGTVQTPTGVPMAAQLDAELMARNEDYEAKRKGGGLEPPVVRLVMPGVFEHWMRHHGKWGGQNKMPRCRSDRLVADGLAQVARFNAD
jgi:hypothetical protein